MRSIPLSRGKHAIVDDDDYDRVMQYRWHCRRDGYAGTHLGIRRSSALLHRFILGITDPAIQVDHIDLDKLNCRKSNLRVATHQQNQRNREKYHRNTTGYKGVFRHPSTQKWRAMITVNGKCVHIGYFHDIEDAARAYDHAACEYFGEFARTNFKVTTPVIDEDF